MLRQGTNSRNDGKRKIVIVGHFGGYNCGDEAMLIGLLHEVAQSKTKHVVHVIVKDVDAVSRIVHGILGVWAQKNVRITPMHFWSVMSALRTADALILAGGTHFQDDYRGMRLLRHFRYLARFVALFWGARCLGLRCAAISQGFGPVDHNFTRWMLWLFIKACHFVSVREKASAQILTRSTSLVPEITFDLSSMYFAQAGLERHEESCVRRIGLSVTELCSSLQSDSCNTDGTADGISRAICQLMNRCPDLLLDILVFREGKRESDISVSERVRDTIEAIHPGRVRLIRGCHNPVIAQESISRCSVFVGMRFHSTMLAYLAGRPLIIIPYHKKLCDLADEIGMRASCVILPSDPRMEAMLAGSLELAMNDPKAFIAGLSVETARQRAVTSTQHAFKKLRLL